MSEHQDRKANDKNTKKLSQSQDWNDEEWEVAKRAIKQNALMRERILNGKTVIKYLASYFINQDEYTNRKGEKVLTPKFSLMALAKDLNTITAGNDKGLSFKGDDYNKMLSVYVNGEYVHSTEQLLEIIDSIVKA
jgi:hypothetical protein